MVDRVDPATMHTITTSMTDSENQEKQVIRRLNMVFPERAKLTALLDETVTISDGRASALYWGEQADEPRYVTVEGTTAANGTEVGAAITTVFISPAGAVVADEQLLDERSMEVLHVTSNTSGALVVGTRGAYGGGTALALPANTPLRILGAAKAEYAAASDPKSAIPTQRYNNFQTFERDVAQSTIARAIEYYLARGGSLESHEAAMAMDNFKWGQENSLFFGSRAAVTVSTIYKRFQMGGIWYWVDAAGNYHDINGAFTYPQFDDMMSDHARVGGGGEYFAFTSQRIGNIMRRWALDYNLTSYIQGAKTERFGLKHDRFTGTNYDLRVFQHEAFEDTTEIGKQMYVIQRGNAKLHYMRGLGPTVNKGIESPKGTGRHGYKDQITGTCTLEVPLIEANCIFRGIES